MEDESIGEKIASANWEGNIVFLQEMANDGLFDPLSITKVELWNYLHRANLVKPSPKETISFYLSKGVPVNAQDCYGMTPLHYAVREHNYGAVKLLLEAGVDPCLKNQDGTDSLIQTLEKVPLEEDIPIIRMLISYGANPYLKNAHDSAFLDSINFAASRRSYLKELANEVAVKAPKNFKYKVLNFK